MTTQTITRTQLAKEKKDALIQRVLESASNLNKAEERVLGAALLGGFAGTLLGLALGSM